MPKRKDPISSAEWKIMKIVWEKNPCSANDVYLAASEPLGWSKSTVKTLLRRLVEKGYLETETVKNSFQYRPTQTALKSLYQTADSLLENAIQGTVGPLLAYMVKKSRLEPEEIAELHTILEQHTKKHP